MDKKFIVFILSTLMILGGFLRFYNLAWGSPYYFHPDERNIAASVSNISFPLNFNPHFFAYGTMPIYLTALAKETIGWILQAQKIAFDPLALAILVGRFFSAILSTLLIPLVFIATKKILTILDDRSNLSNEVDSINRVFLALLGAFLTAFNPGLIQYAHFSTFEIFLTVEYLLIAIFAVETILTGKKRFYLLTGLFLGLATATKINSLMFVPILFLAHWFNPNPKGIRFLFGGLIVFVLTAFLASPFNLLDVSAFKGALNYESSVALGSLAVFYTQSFIKTIPIVFQLKSVLPYLLGWPLTVLGILGGLGILTMILRNKLQTVSAKVLLIFIFIPLTYWIFNSFLFIQWMRYFVPLVPFVIIAAATVLFFRLFKGRPCKFARPPLLKLLLLSLIIASTLTGGLAVLLVYVQPDTRTTAAQWLYQQTKNQPSSKPFVLSEVYDLGITPFNTFFDPSTISLFDFYGLDSDPRLTSNPKQTSLDKKSKLEELSRLLEKSDYIVLPSPRIWRTRLRLPNEFPNGSSFYQKLFNGDLGFTKIADFKNQTCEKLLPIRCLWLNDDGAEETYAVFDRPEVLIFQKTKQLPASDYYRIIYFNQIY